MSQGLAAEIDLLLTPLGFRRREGAWNRRRAGLVDVVSMQVERGERVRVEAGVLHPLAFTRCWGEPVPDFVDAPECTIRSIRSTDNHDRWWDLDESSVAVSVAEHISAFLLPFIEGNRSGEAIEQSLAASGQVRYLVPPETVYLAILRNERGEKAEACALLRRFLDKARGDWREKAEQLLRELRCTESTGQTPQ
jgi:hypothetical protein